MQLQAQTADKTSPDAVLELCPIPTYERIGSSITIDDENNIKILSKATILEKNAVAKFTGGVTLVKQNETIIANELEINQQDATLEANGDIHFQNAGIDVFAEKFQASEKSNSTTLSDTAYQLQLNAGHGNAGSIDISGEGDISLKQSSFTTCYGETPDWLIQASEITLSADENSGVAKHARFRFFDVPLLYIPYFSFPLTNERKTGFLDPKIGTSNKNGFYFEAPYYINIAESMDATLTPNYMTKNGLRLISEFRYLSDLQSGVIDLEYLHKDENISSDDPRYLMRFQHTGTFSENFRVHVDYTTISDDNYLVDIGSKQYNSHDAYLYQIGEVSYFGEQWQASLKFQDFEVLGYNTPSYKTEPQAEFSFVQPLNFSNATFDVYSELSRFTSQNKALQEANRYHVEAGFSVPLSTPAWFVNSEVRLLQTYYDQDLSQLSVPNTLLDESVSRSIPKVRMHGGINFERPMYFNTNFTQTLEPQIQYLYVPEVDQSNIGMYDTTQLQDDYYGLFRDTRYSGLDRIAAANQISWGLTTRVLDDSNSERARFSFGQINYLSSSDTPPTPNNITQSSEESALAAEVFFYINRQWQFSGDLQYDTKNGQANKSQLNVDYHYSENNMVQLNHRYTRNVSGIKLEQLSFLTSVEINKDWQFVGRITQDLQEKRTLESYAGLQYESCCWAVQFAYHRHINAYFDVPGSDTANRDEFDSGFMIKFILKGLSKQSMRDTSDMLNTSIFGYKRPYFLNN